MKNPLMQLEDLGQSVWLDNISRALITSGELERLREQGVLGMTSNPTIFDKAISGSTDYDAQLREILAATPAAETGEIVRALMVKDIQMAADILRPVHARTGGRDGFISLEVTPQKAHDTEATIEEVRELHTRVGRPNVMVKIPATREGLPAITCAIREGYSINVTLIFSVDRYREVANAYIMGLEQRTRDGKSLSGIASVASIFVSRIDTLADELLKK
ncbi:MAG TPA: transaldolase family protein, partial [Bacteroidota bacterium]|nr:transaldolase family protein [Bacteroidota bacterium]